MTLPLALEAVALVVAASACQSVTGFGFALVLVPLLSLVWDIKLAVVTSTLLSTTLLLPLLLEVRSQVQVSQLAPLVGGSLIGIPVGIILLAQVDNSILKLWVSMVVMATAALLYFRPAFGRGDARPTASLLVGALSGMLRTSTSMSGPPVVLYLINRTPRVEVFRATLVAFLLLSSIPAVAGLLLAGQVTAEAAQMFVIMLPATAAGLLLGRWVRRRVKTELFRVLVLLVLLLTSMGVVISASGSLV